MMDKYILDGRTVVLCTDLMAWAIWFETHTDERQIGHDSIANGYEVSTVFLGVDMGEALRVLYDTPDAPPLLFETAVFRTCGGVRLKVASIQRWSTYDIAEAMHADIVKTFRRQANS